MRYAGKFGTTIACIAMCSSLLQAGNARAQDVPVSNRDEVAVNMEKSGRMALEAQQYTEALELFSAGAERAADPGLKARLDFRQAVTLQQMADTSPPRDSAEKLQQAARLYHAYLRQNPQSAATVNNLAKVYATLGEASLADADTERAKAFFSRADTYYQKAVAAKDENQGLYLKNYAEFLEQTGQWQAAKKIYAQLVQGFPVSAALQQSMAASYREKGLGELAEYLWNLQEAGYTRQSAETALAALQQSANVSDDHRVELLTVVCAALAQATDDRGSFAGSNTGRQISALGPDTFIGEGVGEIIALYHGENLQPLDYDWWPGRRSGLRDPGRGLYPIDGFRALIRSLGSRSKRAGDPQLAEAYFKLAAGVNRREVDPVAIRDLVRMYAEADEFTKINDVLDDYQVSLFAGKGDAYRNSHAEDIFQYHQTLGELYTLIERWGDSSKVDSAIFQLEHARSTSMMLADQSRGKLADDYRFTPQMVDQLSRGYENTGRIDKSVELRLDQAEIYKKAGDTRDATRVLAPIEKVDIPANLPGRYRNLLESNSREGLIKIPPEINDKVELKDRVELKDKVELKDH